MARSAKLAPLVVLALWLAACGGESETERIEDSLGGAIYGKTHVECGSGSSKGTWRCAIEDDPGSGVSRNLYVRIDKKGCWRAAPSKQNYVIRRCLD